MPASERAPEHLSAVEPASAHSSAFDAAARGKAVEDGGAGFGTQVLLMMAIFGSATCVTMLGPLLVDLSRDLDVSLGQAGLLAAAMAVTWAISAPFATPGPWGGRRRRDELSCGAPGAGALEHSGRQRLRAGALQPGRPLSCRRS